MLSGLGKNIQEISNNHRTHSHPVSADTLLAFDQTYTHVFSLSNLQQIKELSSSTLEYSPSFDLKKYDLGTFPEIGEV